MFIYTIIFKLRINSGIHVHDIHNILRHCWQKNMNTVCFAFANITRGLNQTIALNFSLSQIRCALIRWNGIQIGDDYVTSRNVGLYKIRVFKEKWLSFGALFHVLNVSKRVAALNFISFHKQNPE